MMSGTTNASRAWVYSKALYGLAVFLGLRNSPNRRAVQLMDIDKKEASFHNGYVVVACITCVTVNAEDRMKLRIT